MPAALPPLDDRVLATPRGTLALSHAGSGPPVLLLHGFPQCRVAWHRVAPALAEHCTVIVPDLPGYGESARLRAADLTPRASRSKRALAAELVAAMRALGYERFGVAGHDRGARVAYRMALDHPERVSRLAVLDVVPTLETVEPLTAARALAGYHWYFLAQPAPFPERLIGADPAFFLAHTLRSWLADQTRFAEVFPPAVLDAYARHLRHPDVVAAMCDDYRAGLAEDLDHDRADRAAGRRVRCALLVLWGESGTDGEPLDYVGVWRRWADDVRGAAVRAGHFLMEEAPEVTASTLARFFGAA